MSNHLKDYQFKPGESGNPKGRPKGSPGKRVRELGHGFIAEIFEKLFVWEDSKLVTWLEENHSRMSRAEKVFMNNSEDLKHLNSLMDRVVGTPTKVEFIDEDGGGIPIQFNIVRHHKHGEKEEAAKGEQGSAVQE